MGVFKEEASAFEAIKIKQTRIYNDAADYGISYNTNDVPPEITAVYQTIAQFKMLDGQFPDEKPFIRKRETWGDYDSNGPDGVSIEVVICWETDGGRDYGTKYFISFNKLTPTQSLINKGHNAVISVDIEKYSEKS
jgi:hypothetical protein